MSLGIPPTMTDAAAAALRKPFPASAVGKLPKPYKADSPKGNCPECHGYHGLPAVHLDYVGHAAVTDRLLSVDPNWSWEPFALDERGLPALDGRSNLWIRLTILGVTRVGVGDGKSAKEVIGDAIRNAAMRFGVALDLWGKEELEQAHEPAQRPTVPRPAQVTSESITGLRTPGPDDPPLIAADALERKALSPRARGRMFALFNDAGMADEKSDKGRQVRLDYIAQVIGRQVTSSNDLSPNEASAVIQMLEKDIRDQEAQP